MRLTPLEIKKQIFARTLLGYRVDEIHSYLEFVSDDMERVLLERNGLGEQVAKLSHDNENFRRIEQSLRDAMLLASEAVQKAESRGDEIIAAAHARSRSIVAAGEARCEELLEDISERRAEIVFEVESLEQQRAELLRRLNELVKYQKEFLESYERDEVTKDDEVTKEAGREGRVLVLARPMVDDAETA